MRLDLAVTRDRIPYFQHWLGLWSIHGPAADLLLSRAQSLDVAAHLARIEAATTEELEDAKRDCYSVVDGVAVINIDGPLMKHESSYGASCSTVRLRRMVRKAVSDSDVKGLCFRIESPGGSVAGTMEAHDDIRAASAVKPTMAYCEDLCASAAYWLAAACGRIHANAAAFVGSIGTYCVVADSSQAAAKAGVTVHVVRAGEQKGAFTAGTEITEAQLADLQTEVDSLNAFFLKAVSEGRGKSSAEVAALADGRVHIAAEAQKLGLIDGVATFDAAFESFVNSLSSTPDDSDTAADPAASTEPLPMTADSPVTAKDLAARFPKSTAAWRLKCLEAGFTMAQCAEAYSELLQARVDALEADAKRKKLGVKPNKLAGKKTKAKGRRARAEEMPVEEDDEEELLDEMIVDEEDDELEEMAEDDDTEAEDEEENVTARWQKEFAAELRRCNGNRAQALRNLNRRNPQLREAYRKATEARVLKNRQIQMALARRARQVVARNRR